MVNLYPILINNAFVKLKPNSYLLSYFLDNFRTAVLINKSAFDILKLCDGTNTVKEIAQILAKEYGEKEETTTQFGLGSYKGLEKNQ